MTARSHESAPDLHVATIAHAERLWDAYLEFEDDPLRPDVYRARLRFDPANAIDFEETNPRTTVIIIEESYEQAVAKARAFDERALEALLHSALPSDPEPEGAALPEGAAPPEETASD